jgi:hypothetical protein
MVAMQLDAQESFLQRSENHMLLTGVSGSGNRPFKACTDVSNGFLGMYGSHAVFYIATRMQKKYTFEMCKSPVEAV